MTEHPSAAPGTDNISLYALEGCDRDCAVALLSQSRLTACSPIDDIQVRHLLAIGYRAGRAVTEDDVVFDRTDARLGNWAALCVAAAVGAVLTGLLVWILG